MNKVEQQAVCESKHAVTSTENTLTTNEEDKSTKELKEEVPSVVELLAELNSRIERIVKESTVAIKAKEKILTQLVTESTHAVSDLERLKQMNELELKRLSDALDVFKESLPKMWAMRLIEGLPTTMNQQYLRLNQELIKITHNA